MDRSFYEGELDRMMRDVFEKGMRNAWQQTRPEFDSQAWQRSQKSRPQKHPTAIPATPEIFHDSYTTVPNRPLKDPIPYDGGEDVSMLVSCNPGRFKKENDITYCQEARWRAQLLNPEWESKESAPYDPRRERHPSWAYNSTKSPWQGFQF